MNLVFLASQLWKITGAQSRAEERKKNNLYPLTELPDLTIYPELTLQQSRQLTYHNLIHAFSF